MSSERMSQATWVASFWEDVSEGISCLFLRGCLILRHPLPHSETSSQKTRHELPHSERMSSRSLACSLARSLARLLARALYISLPLPLTSSYSESISSHSLARSLPRSLALLLARARSLCPSPSPSHIIIFSEDLFLLARSLACLLALCLPPPLPPLSPLLTSS